MLTEKERARLEPFLARVRTIRAQLAVADQEKIAAAALWKESKNGSDWRDRSFGGRFSRKPARRAWTSAAAASSALTKQATKLEQKLDKQIGPMMPQLDLRYQDLADAIKNYNQALKPCQQLRRLIAEATDAAQTATKKPGRDDKDHQAAVSARRHYMKLVAQARHAAPHAQLALYSLSQTVKPAGGGSPHVAWDAVLLDRLPRAVDDRSTLQQLARAQEKLDRAIARLKSWRAETTAAQQRAVQATRERLINDPECWPAGPMGNG